jgi:hypothetical protein
VVVVLTVIPTLQIYIPPASVLWCYMVMVTINCVYAKHEQVEPQTTLSFIFHDSVSWLNGFNVLAVFIQKYEF